MKWLACAAPQCVPSSVYGLRAHTQLENYIGVAPYGGAPHARPLLA